MKYTTCLLKRYGKGSLVCRAAAVGAATVIFVLTTGVLTPVFGQYLEGVIDVEAYQAQVLANPLSNKIYTSNHIANKVTIIDGATRQIITTKSVSGEPWFFCLNTVSNKVYCLPVSSSRLAIIDGVTDSVKRLTIPHGGPSAFAYNSTLNRLYVGCNDEGTVVVVDGAGDTVSYELTLAPSHVVTVFWNPASNYLFCGTFEDTMYVIDCQTNQVTARWNVPLFDEWCYSPVTGRAYTGYANTVWAFSPRGDSLLAAIPQGSSYLCAVPFPDKVYIERGARTYVLDGSTNVIVDTIQYAGGGVICDTSKGKVYVLGGVWVLDARADTLLTTIPLPAFNQQGVCRNPLDGRVYVTDQQGDSVYVLRDTMPGIEESRKPQAVSHKPMATVVRGVLWLPSASSHKPQATSLLDISGRKVLDLKTGANDVSRLAPGVYFVRAVSRELSAGGCHKVVIAR